MPTLTLKPITKALVRSLGFEIRRLKAPDPLDQVVSWQPGSAPKGRALLAYGIRPYLLKPGEPINTEHTTAWESLQIGKTFLELGYALDVVHYTNQKFVPERNYDCFVGVLIGFSRLAPLLNPGCLKVLHIVYAHWLFHNSAQYKRLLDIKNRRGVSLTPMKLLEPDRGIEYADCATILGNHFTSDTYRYAGRPLYRIPVSTQRLFDWHERKDFEQCRRRYLWFGGIGLAHKGLDLVLEAFAGMPDMSLTVCGPISGEKDFEKTFHKELYETPNIRTNGWMDVNSPKLRDIYNSCLGIVYPSCSEGQAGAVINCLHAGLLPVVSYESGVDVSEDCGIVLGESSIAEIQRRVRELSSRPVGQLRDMARGSWEFARANHTRERFAAEYKRALTEIMATRS